MHSYISFRPFFFFSLLARLFFFPRPWMMALPNFPLLTANDVCGFKWAWWPFFIGAMNDWLTCKIIEAERFLLPLSADIIFCQVWPFLFLFFFFVLLLFCFIDWRMGKKGESTFWLTVTKMPTSARRRHSRPGRGCWFRPCFTSITSLSSALCPCMDCWLDYSRLLELGITGSEQTLSLLSAYSQWRVLDKLDRLLLLLLLFYSRN